MGVVTFAIMGMLYKIIPFLVWFGVYSQHIGRAQVPALADMYSPRLQMIGYWSFLAGLVAISVGILRESESGVRLGSLLFTTSVLVLLAECRQNSGPRRPSPNHAAVQPARCKQVSRMNLPAPLNEQTVLDALRQVIDPEIGCNIVDLGLIYDVAITGPRVTVQMTLTTPGCPMSESIAQGAQWALLGIAGVEDAAVELVWDPPWQPSMMTAIGRAAIGMR